MSQSRTRVFGFACCLLFCLPLCGFAQLNPNPTIPESFGVDVTIKIQPDEVKMLADAGAHWIRTGFYWGWTERTKGVYKFDGFDNLLNELQPYGIHSMFILVFANKLYDDGLAPHTDAGREAFARWVVAAVEHFRGRGIIWELWNEPDDGSWAPKPNADDYAKLALTVGKAIRQVAPEEIYVGPATSGFAWNFIETCFKAGVLNYWTAVSLHPYRQGPPETVAADYRRLRDLIAKYAPGRQIPIIASEWGYSVDWPFVSSEDMQADFAVRSLLSNLASGVMLTIWYDWNYHPFSLVRGDRRPGQALAYEPRQCYWAFQTLTRTLSTYHFAQQLPANDGDYILEFQDGGSTRVVAWTTGNPHSATVQVKGLTRATDIAGRTLPKPVPSPKGVMVTLTQAPQYLVP